MIRAFARTLQMAVLAVVVIIVLLVASAKAAQASETRTVTVSGQCLRKAFPDRGSIALTAEFMSPDIKVASKQASDQYQELRKQIQDLKFKDLEMTTSEFTVTQVYDRRNKKTVSLGYRARMGLQVVTSEVERIGEIIALASKAKVKDVSSLSQFLSDEKYRSEREACLEEAIEHASSKADRMAKAARAKLGKVMTLVEEGGSNYAAAPMMMREEADMSPSMGKSAAPPQIDSKAQTIQLSVNAVYTLE